MVLNGVTFPEEELNKLCRLRGVRRLSLFGSILRKDFRAESDIDMLVEFEKGRTPGFFGFAGLQMELSQVMGRRVHLHTASMLGPTYRDDVLRSVWVQYAA
jgi:uncharacterized protein